MKLSKESHALSHSLNSYLKEHANEPMGHEKKEMKSKESLIGKRMRENFAKGTAKAKALHKHLDRY